MASPPSPRGMAARIAPRSCSGSLGRTTAPIPSRRMLHEDRLLRLEPALLLLERRRDLLSWAALGPRAAGPSHHFLRARRLRPAAAPRQGPAGLGRGAGLAGDGG